MTMKPPNTTRILAVEPGIQYLGIAILEGEELIWYGIKAFPGRKTLPYMRQEIQQYLSTLLKKFHPDVLAVEEPFYAQSMLSKNLRTLTTDIKTWGRWKGLRVYSYLPTAVKAYFCRDQQTKESLAMVMIEKYPFLARYLPLLPWNRRYWFHVFDPVSLGLMSQRKLLR